jgi:hypothetical protein
VTSGSVTVLDGSPSTTPPMRRFPSHSYASGQTHYRSLSQRVLTTTDLSVKDTGQSQESLAYSAVFSAESLVFEYYVPSSR